MVETVFVGVLYRTFVIEKVKTYMYYLYFRMQ